MHVLDVGRLGLAFDPESLRRIVDHGARAESNGHSLDAGDGTHFFVEMTQPRATIGRSSLGISGQRQDKSNGVIGIESGIDAPKGGETAKHQAGADEQDQSHGYFDDDEYSLKAVARAAGTAATFFKNIVQVHAGSF